MSFRKVLVSRPPYNPSKLSANIGVVACRILSGVGLSGLAGKLKK